MKKRLRRILFAPSRTEPHKRRKLFADEEAIETFSRRIYSAPPASGRKLFADEEAIETR